MSELEVRACELHTTESIIAELIDAGQISAAENALTTLSLRTPLAQVLRAEIEIYFSRLAEAERILDRVAPEVREVDVVARYAMARGELAYWLYRYEEADEFFHMALHFYKFLGDTFRQAVAFYNLGRLERRRARLGEAEDFLNRASEMIADYSTPPARFLRGLIWFNLGVCCFERGQLEKGGKLLKRAVRALRKSGETRYYGLALNFLGAFYLYLGRYAEAIKAFQKSRSIFEKLDIPHDLEHSANNMAVALTWLGRYDEAEPLLREALEMAQQIGDVGSASGVLGSFAELYLAKGDLDRAESYVSQALECADLARNLYERGRALVQQGRIAFLKGRYYESQRVLREALEISQKLQSREIEAAACVYMAELMLAQSPLKAEPLLAQAEHLLNGYPNAYLRAELERVRRKKDTGRICIEEDRLVIDGTRLPKWYEAKEALEIFLIRKALEHAEGNMSRAGKLLGTSRVHVKKKKKQYGL